MTSVAEGRSQAPSYHVLRFVLQNGDLVEPPDLGVPEQVGEPCCVTGGRLEAVQARVPVRIGDDEQRVARRHEASGTSLALEPAVYQPLLVTGG